MEDRTLAIVGAGPVGLFLALRALEEGLVPTVFERRRDPRGGSRSIGVHPPSLELLDGLGLTERFLSRGVLVRRGLAFGASGPLGAIGFEACRPPHRYVLTIAQEDSESILREALDARAPTAVREGCEVIGVTSEGGSATLRARGDDGTARDLRFAAIVGCDGKHSATRSASGIPFEGATYEGSYAMADFPDTTGFGSDAAIFLAGEGLVESFPLPGGLRRWVVRRARGSDGAAPSVDEIAETIAERTGHRVPSREVRASSGFRAERFIASSLTTGAIALAGDAAHVVSPIGGQGMNLGWLGASSLAHVLGEELRAGRDPSAALAVDARNRRRVARAVARRAELDMWLGRPTLRPERRDRIVSSLLRGPCAGLLARVFTMRGLAFGI